MKILMCLLALFLLMMAAISVARAGQKNVPGKIVKSSTASEISLEELAKEISGANIVVLGEEHYSLPIQASQARIIKALVKASGAKGNFTTAWEFLDAADQKFTDHIYKQLRLGNIDAYDFLDELFGEASSLSYAPIIGATNDLGGRLIGVNISRLQKRPVSQKGISAADPKIVPPGFALGSKRYFERFKEGARHHAQNDTQLKNMFDAQCLTDEVMAYNLLADKAKLKFLVVGSFHSDFYDGVVARLQARSPGSKIVNIRFMDVSEYREDEIPAILHSLQYGRLADYVYFVGNFKKD
jgi:uncharacterized iron-regulated protein